MTCRPACSESEQASPSADLVKKAQALRGLPRLRTLDLTSNRLLELPGAPGPACLQDLWLEANRLQDAEALLRSLAAAARLTSLTLHGNPCAGPACTQQAWAALPSLRQLDERTRPAQT